MFTLKGENKNQLENAETLVILYDKTTQRRFLLPQQIHVSIIKSTAARTVFKMFI